MEWNNKISENVQAVPFLEFVNFDLASTMKDVISLGVENQIMRHLIELLTHALKV